MKRYLKFYVLVLFLALSGKYSVIISQEYSAATIPAKLKENANAVLRESSQSFIQSDINSGIYKVHRVITILNSNGNKYAHFQEYGDKFREITSFSGIVRDASGKVVRKIKKGDLTISSISDNAFASDNYTITYECQSPVYPYTIEYTYQEKWKNGILTYPAFVPFEGYSMAIEKAEYRVEIPKNLKFRYRENYKSGLRKEEDRDKNIYSIMLKDKEAIPYEPLAPSYKEIFPFVLAAPADFCYDSYCGNMNNWKNYGLWISDLLKDRDRLPSEFVAKIRDLIKDAPTTREKARILFYFLQKNSRYVSIQLGIGGYQPADATSVAKNRLGDCKGLTNLMKAMLKAVGIPSNYCVISMREKELYSDFPSFSQADHVILLIPQKNDSIWLECTSQTLPFGYIHQDISGHDALVISESGGTLCRLPTYTDAQNRKNTTVDIHVNEDGGAYGNIVFSEYLNGYERVYRAFQLKERKKLIEYINANMRIPQMQVNEIETREDLSALPLAELNTTFETKDFANKTGTRLFIPICPLKKTNFNIFSSSERNIDIVITNGFSESDLVVINIPESFGIESLPKDILLETPFGVLSTSIKKENNKIIYSQNIDILAGTYDKEQYFAIKDFFAQITSAVKRNLVLKKQ